MGVNRTTLTEAPVPASTICGAEAASRSRCAHGHSLRPAERRPVEPAATGNGLRLRQYLLATARALATRRRLETAPCGPARGATTTWSTRLGAGRGRQLLPPRATRGKKTGPNPTDRRKAGSKHHVLTDAQGIPLVAILTAANRNDITQLLPLVDAMPLVRGGIGHPIRKPRLIQGDRGYDSQRHRDELHRRGIAAELAKRRTPHGSGLGRTRWVVERTLAWLHRFRRLAVRYERRPCVHEAFLSLACSLVCWYYLKPIL